MPGNEGSAQTGTASTHSISWGLPPHTPATWAPCSLAVQPVRTANNATWAQYPPRPQKRPSRWRCGRGSVVVRCFSEKRLNGDARFGLGSRDWTRRPSRIFRSGRVLPLAICTEVADHESSGDGILPFFLLLRGKGTATPCAECLVLSLPTAGREHFNFVPMIMHSCIGNGIPCEGQNL
eukprot:COSAG02_NODE_1436_length_12609_cov_1282.385292_3_plen_179_part_00